MPRPDPLPTVTDLLKAIPYFSHVDGETLRAVARSAVRRTYESDQVALLEGEPSAGLFVVQSGWLKSVKSTPQGREGVIRVVGPGEVFNAIGALASETNPGTVIALEPATVWILPREDLLRSLEEHPSLSSAVTQALAARVQSLMDQVEDLALRSVAARLARFLVESARDGIVHRKAWETQAELAARLGTALNVLNRTLKQFSEDGLIDVEREAIRLLDPERLAMIAQLE
jgi:CRP/FNR family transcriptional regulator